MFLITLNKLCKYKKNTWITLFSNNIKKNTKITKIMSKPMKKKMKKKTKIKKKMNFMKQVPEI